MLAYLRLLRLPALFTAFPDVLAGYAVALGGVIDPLSLTCLLAASGLLYLSGMVFNDLFDYEQDLQERPQRPLPSGAITRQQATLLGSLLMLSGIAIAFCVNVTAGGLSLLLAGLILAYDSGGKKTAIGPLLMGGCRSVNLLLGAAVLPDWSAPQLPIILVLAGLIGLYVVGITLFAASEAVESPRGRLQAGLACLLLALIGWATAAATQAHESSRLIAMVMLGLITYNLTRRALPALRTGQPRLVQQAVRFLLLTIPMLEATAIVAHSPPAAIPLAMAAALMMLPGQILSRWISMT